MVEMNPYYARESEVGPVFDAATYSRRRGVTTGTAGLVMGGLLTIAAVYAWNPDWVLANPPQWFAEAHDQAKDLWKLYPRGASIGVGVGGASGALFLVMGFVHIYQALTGQFFLRAGEGGVSLCVPAGFGVLRLDLPWDEIDKLTVVQEKQFGSLSRNAGNLGAYLDLVTRSHGRHHIRLDDFREPGHIIHSRITDASESRPASVLGAGVEYYGELVGSAR